jgi:hypothetical protein
MEGEIERRREGTNRGINSRGWGRSRCVEAHESGFEYAIHFFELYYQHRVALLEPAGVLLALCKLYT